MTIERVAAIADDTLDQTGDTLVDSLTLTPPSGDYFLFATVQFRVDGDGETDFTTFSVYVDGAQIAHTEREYHEDTSIDNTFFTYALSCKVSVNGSQAVEIRYRTDGPSTPLVAEHRELALFPMPVAGTNYEQSATGNDSVSSSGFVTLGSMSVTPVADDYLLVFTTSVDGPSGSTATYQVAVGGSKISGTARLNQQESSAADDEMPIMIACKVSPNGSQVVEIEWELSGGSGSRVTHERTMNLIPMDAGDIFEAVGTVADTDSTTTDKQLDDMLITAPGADDYLAMFSCTDFYPTLGNNQGETTYSIRAGGTKVTDSERITEHEGSVDDTDMCAIAGGRVVVVGGSDDLQLYWQSSDTLTRTARERIFVAIREAAAEGLGIPVAMYHHSKHNNAA